MPLAKFDPWQCLRQTQTNAYGAYSACRGAGLSRKGMLGTEGVSLIGDFEERVAILEFSGGFTRADAEDIAANAVGFASPRDLQAAAIEHWRSRLRLTNRKDHALIADGLTLVNGPWIAALVALGWDEISLFGFDPRGRDVTGLVAAVGQQSIIAATADSVRYLDHTHVLARHHYRFTAATENISLIWELGADPTMLNARECQSTLQRVSRLSKSFDRVAEVAARRNTRFRDARSEH